jgi:hypothetical protein
MKIQIDTTAKTLKLEEAVKLNELFKALDNLFPNEEWREFTLITDVTINWTSYPIIIKKYPVYPTWPSIPSYPYQPYPWITYINDNLKYQLNTGIYDVQI